MDVQSVEQFEEALRYDGLTIVKFYMDGCAPCKKLDLVFHEVLLRYPEVQVLNVDVVRHPLLGKQHDVRAVPALAFYRNTVRFAAHVGFLTAEQLETLLRSLV